MNKAILDSSFLVGYFDRGDVWHSKAVMLMEKNDVEGVILDCVLNEIFSVLCRRAKEKGEGKKFNKIIDSVSKRFPRQKIVWSYPDIKHHYDDILSLMREHQGELNFHDCLIALVSREKGIKKMVSFDQGFDRIQWLERIG